MGKKRPTLVKPPQRMTKKERSRWEKERRIQRNFIMVLSAIGVVALLLLAFGLLYDQVLYPRGVIAKVNDQALTRRDYWEARRMNLINQWQDVYQTVQLYETLGIELTEDQETTFGTQLSSILQQLNNVKQEGVPREAVIQKLIEETIVLQEAQARGIEVTDQEIDAFLLPDPQPAGDTPLEGATVPLTQTQPAPTPSDTLTPQERSAELRAFLDDIYKGLEQDMGNFRAGNLGFSADDYIAMVRRSVRFALTEERVKEQLAEALDKTEEQVWAYHILLRDRATRANQAYQAALNALAEGRSLAEIVVQYSEDEDSRDQVSRVEIRRGEASPSVEEAAWALTADNPYSEVLADGDQVYLLKLVRHDEAADAVVVQQIRLPADREPVAQALWAEVQADPESFALVAVSSSEDPATAGQGGDLGWIDREGDDHPLDPQVVASALALTPTNAISAPIRDAEGNYHLLQLVTSEADRVRVRRILVRSGAGLAQQLLDEVRAGATSFSQAALAYAEDEAAGDLAGDIGWITQDDARLPPEVLAAALALSPTGSLTITHTPAAHYVVQLVERDDDAARLRLRIILVKSAETLLSEIRDYIVAGDDVETQAARFKEMAVQYSDDTVSKAQGGDLGWFAQGKTATTIEIEEQAFTTPPGQLSENFLGPSGWHLVWVQEYSDSRLLDEATLNQRAQEAYDRWKADLISRATIVRYPPPAATPGTP